MSTPESKSLFQLIGHAKRSRERRHAAAEEGYPVGDEEGSVRNLQVAPGVARRAWAEADGQFWGTPQSHDGLPVGLYRMGLAANIGPYFQRQQNDTDALVELPDSASAAVIREIHAFRGLRQRFKDHGYLYKRGILLWGPPGSGKTTTLQLLAKMMMQEEQSVTVLVDSPQVATMCLQALRRIEPDRQVVALLEDLDALCERYDESAFLALLDGESQVDNIVFVATTNYPERLDKRFVDRPSRFDTVRYIGMPDAAARTVYLRSRLPHIDEVTLHDFVKSSEGFSVAHMRELVILTQCFEMPLREAAKRLCEMRVTPTSEMAPDRPSFGFGG
jgi:energy-coupling factor transporter ATP-binding protein EcfA2